MATHAATNPSEPTSPPLINGESWTTNSHSKQNPDGTITTDLYGGPAFRKGPKGWLPIDTTVSPVNDGTHAASATGAIRPVEFGRSASNLVDLALDGGHVVVSAPTLHISAPQVARDGVSYANVAPDTDLRYLVGPRGLKEEFVLRSGASPTEFTLHVSDPAHQLGTLTPQPDGSFRSTAHLDSNVEVDFAPPATFVGDGTSSSGNEPNSAHLGMNRSGDGWDVTVTVDGNWLRGKQFPVVLDPTIGFNEANGTLTDASDANVTGGTGGANTANTSDPYAPVGSYTDESDPAVASWGPTNVLVYMRGTNNQLVQKSWNGSAWSGWLSVPGNFTLASDPAAVSWGTNRVDIFARGSDTAIWHTWWDGAWHAWESLGGNAMGAPAVASWGSNHLDLFTRATDGTMWTRQWNGTVWTAWAQLGTQVFTSDPGAVSWGSGRIDVFGRQPGTNNLLHAWYTGAWSAWENLGGGLSSAPDVASFGVNRLDVFVRGSDNAEWHISFDGSWHPWESQGGVAAAAPGVVSRPTTGTIDTFVDGADRGLWQKSWTGSSWTAWGSLGANQTVGTTDMEPSRAFFKYDLSQIPASSTINQATLALYIGDCVGSDPGYGFHSAHGTYHCDSHYYNVELHQLTADWSGSSTWNTLNTIMSPTAFQTIGQGAFAQPAPSAPTPVTTDITSTVRSWSGNRTTPSFGFVAKLASEAYNIGGPAFYSSDNGWPYHPTLTVKWTPPLPAPGQVLASTASDTSAQAQWTPPALSPSDPAITAYNVAVYQHPTSGADIQVASFSVGPTTLSALQGGLTKGAQYYFAITAVAGTATSLATVSNRVVPGSLPIITDTVTPDVPTSTGYVVRGQSLSYRTSVTNNGSSAMSVTSLSDTFPSDLSLAPASGVTVNGGTCAALGLTCSLANNTLSVTGLSSIAPGAHYDFVYSVVPVGGGRGCSSTAATAQVSNTLGQSQALSPITICDTGLGVEPWWSFFKRGTGPQGQAMVNPANGNLVLQQTDSAPVQAHGHLSYVLRRSYNSQDSTILTLPGSIGAGWQFNIGQADDLATQGVTPSGLYVPPAQTAANPIAVTLIDRDGTRHVFQPKGLAASASLDIASLPAALATLNPKVLAKSLLAGTHVCVEQTYSSPPGVHLGLWRYVQVSTSVPCNGGGVDTASGAAVLGYAAERPDRLRYEFAWNGAPLDMTDGNGVELRYLYEATPLNGPIPAAGVALGRLTNVYEPASCADPAVGTCRAFRFNYSPQPVAGGPVCATLTGASEVCAADPAGRVTTYQLDANTPARLTEVDNPDGNKLTYAYGTCAGSATQLCSATDARNAMTSVVYQAAPFGPPRVSTLTDRLGNAASPTVPITFKYETPSYVTADEFPPGTTIGHRTRYQAIDSSGRVGGVMDGDTNDNYSRQDLFTWDTPSSTCRQPDAVVDNNLCSVTKKALTNFSTDETTSYLYSPEGMILRSRQALGSLNLDTTYGYAAQYFEATSSAPVPFTDTVGGGGGVTSQGGAGRSDSATLFAVSDRTQSLPPNGNASPPPPAGGQPTTWQSYLTTYYPDNNPGATPNTTPSSGTCSNPNAPASNTGNVCETDAPSPTTPPANRCVDQIRTQRTLVACTRSTYDVFGQKTSSTSPDAMAATTQGQPTSYTYYADADRDLSGLVSSGGWLKGVTDPTGHFVAFAYDHAGNVARTWDRNATQGQSLSVYPGTVSAPPSTAYHETLYAPAGSTAYSAPWRYLRSDRDPLGNVTSYDIDANGNRLTIHPPRGNAAGNGNFDISQTFDAGDDLATNVMPREKSANQRTINLYDVFGNRTQATDPDGHVQTWGYDVLNRLANHTFSRGAYPTDGSPVPASCSNSASGSAFGAGKEICVEGFSYDGMDHQTGIWDANSQVSLVIYDGAGRPFARYVPRFDGTITWLITEQSYDPDGNVTDVCSPRQFTEGGFAMGPPLQACVPTGSPPVQPLYSRHNEYDLADHVFKSTTYRGDGTTQPSTHAYDADGNETSVTDANGHQTTTSFNLLDRKVSQIVPRDATTNFTTSWNYDPSGNTTSVVRPVTSTTTKTTAYSYDADNRPLDTVEGADNVNAAQAGLVDTNGGINVRTRVAYDADGQVVANFEPRAFTNSTTTPSGEFMVRTDYDVDGNPTVQYVPRYDGSAYSDLGLSSTQTQQCTTAPSPAPQTITGVPAYPAGVGVCVTKATFDPAELRTQLRLPTSNGSDNRYVNFAYTDDNLLASVDAPSPLPAGGRVTSTSYVYDGNAKPVLTNSAVGTAAQTTTKDVYNSDEMLAYEVFTSGAQADGTTATHVTKHFYDADGNETQTIDPMGNPTQASYFADDLKKAVTVGGTDTNNVTSYTYDAVGNPSSVTSPSATAKDLTNPSGTPTTNTYTYDNLLATSTIPVSSDGKTKERRTTFGYDGSGRKTSATIDEVNTTTGTPVVTASAGTQNFSYFSDDRLNTETGRTGETIAHTYDPAGHTRTVHDSTGGGSTITSSYYLDGLPRTVDDGSSPTGRTTNYTYDGSGATAARSDAVDGSSTTYATQYTYNDASLVQQLSSSTFGAAASTWTYDAAGRPATETDPNGQSTTWTYNADNTLRTQSLTKGAATLAKWDYNYDNDGRKKNQSFTGTAGTGGTLVTGAESFGYDSANRIKSYTDPSSALHTISWDHDGNRTGVAPPITATHADEKTATYNADDSINTFTDGANNVQGPYAYSPAGDLLSDICNTHTFDGYDRMTTSTQVAGVGCPTPSAAPSATYTYDGVDRQRSHAEGTSTTALHYNGGSQSVSIETATAGDTVYELTPAGDRKAVKQSTTTQYLADDGHGNIATATDATGSVACTVRFDAFGSAIGGQGTTGVCNTGSTFNDYFFRGARRDTTSGDYQFGSRTYDPGKASFLMPDSYRGGSSDKSLSVGTDPLTRNTYSYVNGDPVNLVDPDGHVGCAAEATAEDQRACSQQLSKSNNYTARRDSGSPPPTGIHTYNTGSSEACADCTITYNDRGRTLRVVTAGGMDVTEQWVNLNGTPEDRQILKDVHACVDETALCYAAQFLLEGGTLKQAEALRSTLHKLDPSTQSTGAVEPDEATQFVLDSLLLFGAGATVKGALALRAGADLTTAEAVTATAVEGEGVASGLPPLRQAYVDKVASISDSIAAWEKAGADPEFIAREAWADRRAVGIEYKSLTPRDMLDEITARNIGKYGDPLGPTIDWLRAQGKTWQQIIETATKPGGEDMGF